MTSRVSFLKGLLLILQLVVMAGLSVVSGPQLIGGEVTPEAFTDICVFTITLLVASRQLLSSAAGEKVVGDTMPSASLLGLVIWSVIMINPNTWDTSIRVFESWINQHCKPVSRRIWNTGILSSRALRDS